MGLDLRHVTPSAIKNDLLDYFTRTELRLYPAFIAQHLDLFVEIEDPDTGKDAALFFVEKGYQRKGMIPAFYKDFKNAVPYIDIASVKKAYQYIEPASPDLLVTFKEQFIDNFIEGESIFFASW